MHILLTNDDSIASPLLALTAAKLRQLGDVTLVAPKEEQSWRGKAITRFHPLRCEQSLLDGHTVFVVSGTPADCVNLALYNLLESPPDLVVSGTNAGANTGLGFILSSGTLGACFEANLAGIPAVALSQALAPEDWTRYHAENGLPSERWRDIWQTAEMLLDTFFAARRAEADLLAAPVTWNVNFPARPKPHPRLVPCSVGLVRYGSCFELNGGCYQHNLKDVCWDNAHAECDEFVLRRGDAAITRLDLRKLTAP